MLMMPMKMMKERMCMMVKVGMVSLGCPKNQMDAELMLASIETAEYTLVSDAALADVVVINTCGFIESAKREAIETILEFAQLKKEGQIKRIVVTGCFAERYRDELMTELPECDAIIGLGANRDIAGIIREVIDGETVMRFPDKSCWTLDGSRVQTTPHFFAYLRVGDGCDNRCAYCAIPMIRGPLRSRNMDMLVDEARALAENGVRELVLVAQDTTLYGVDIYGEPRLPELLEQLCDIDGLRWIRLLYCYPEHVTGRLLEVMAAQDKIVKYMDIPIQHASAKVLRDMNRNAGAVSMEFVRRVRAAVPGIVLRTTVMTGFPGEGEEEFTELCEFVREAKFERLGCFAFSPEEGTPAAEMSGQLTDDVKQHRQELVMEEQFRVLEAFNNSRIGQTVEVLVESYDRYAECWFGRTAADAPDIDCKVFFTADGVSPGQFVHVKITDVMDFDLIAELA